MGDQKYRHVLPTTTSTFSPKGETEKRACNDLHDALPLMCQGCQSARFNKMTHDKSLRSLNRLASRSLGGTVNFVKGLDHWLPFCQALKGCGGSCGRLIHDRSCFSIPQAEYIVRFSQAHHISVRLAGAVSMLWSVRELSVWLELMGSGVAHASWRGRSYVAVSVRSRSSSLKSIGLVR